jgi:hypothetical protein
MSASFHVFWLSCTLGSVALAAGPARPAAFSLTTVGLGLAAGLRLAFSRYSLSPETTALLIALAGAALLLSGRGAILRDALAGIVAGFAAIAWAQTTGLPGASLGVALVVAAIPTLAAAYLSAVRPSFAPPAVRDEALLLTIALGLVAAVLPGIADGWRSAEALNVGAAAAASAMPAWIVASVVGMAGLGAVYTWWRRA